MAKPKYIKTPDMMWELFEEYRKHVKDNPRYKVEYVGKDGDKVRTPIEQPLIMEGFRSFCRNKGYSIEHYFANTNDSYTEYRTVITRIREEIRTEQISGGMTGFYNSNLTARVNGLSERQDIDMNAKVSPFKGIDLDVQEDNSAE